MGRYNFPEKLRVQLRDLSPSDSSRKLRAKREMGSFGSALKKVVGERGRWRSWILTSLMSRFRTPAEVRLLAESSRAQLRGEGTARDFLRFREAADLHKQAATALQYLEPALRSSGVLADFVDKVQGSHKFYDGSAASALVRRAELLVKDAGLEGLEDGALIHWIAECFARGEYHRMRLKELDHLIELGVARALLESVAAEALDSLLWPAGPLWNGSVQVSALRQSASSAEKEAQLQLCRAYVEARLFLEGSGDLGDLRNQLEGLRLESLDNPFSETLLAVSFGLKSAAKGSLDNRQGLVAGG